MDKTGKLITDNPDYNQGTMAVYQAIGREQYYAVTSLAEVQAAGGKLYAAHLRGEQMYDAYDYTGATGFLIGNEGNGLTDETADQADVYIRIPMGGKLESLNAAMAAGILMYEVNRQRRSK